MNPAQSPKSFLNLNDIPQSERHSRVFDEFDRLKTGEMLEISVSHEPKLLLKQFKTLREGAYDWQVLESSEGSWRFGISKIKDATAAQSGAKIQGCCGGCGGH